MKKILLVCNAGMSTSILVEKMKKVAIEQNIEVEITALSSTEASVNKPKVDCVLIGPQLKFAKDEIKKVFSEVPVEVIDMRVYGTINGEKALAQAVALLGE